MYLVKRVDSNDPDFQKLVRDLDKDLAIRDGDEHAFFDQFNKITDIKYVVLVYENNIPVGCGAIKEYEKNVMEVKRMFVPPKNAEEESPQLFYRNLKNGPLN